MSETPQTIHLTDYKRPTHWINKTDLVFDIFDDHTIVTSTLKITKNDEYKTPQNLCLDGDDHELLDIAIDGKTLTASEYSVFKNGLKLQVDKSEFELKTVVKIHPETNYSCEGLYRSGSIYCTQNEAEGFRKITYYLDRPDVMSKFTTKIIASKERFPLLLANGNPIEVGQVEGERHFAIWEDPFLKPCYLFALVAGDLEKVSDHFVTKSGRKVALEIYVDKGNGDKCGHAMESLKNSMRWDEEKFGLEYDLDIYMIVAVDTFNMGAMENKGLNIFNSAYVLAKTETATDGDFQGIEGVIGHEYFHNWTGNRVTCRDWFQLTLKEGLTVFRDQEFSADMLSRPVKRIEDVMRLRAHQFAEDAGPMSHPIKPKSYIEINNFYTATVYEKGAEVIRMIHTLIGADNFRKGMDLYFERHDGQAVTTEDFVQAMADASGKDLEHFKVWYDQNGTPEVFVETLYDAKNKNYHLKLKQSVKTNNKKYQTVLIPWKYGLITADGKEFNVPNDGLVEFSDKEMTISIENVDQEPTPSLNRNFSAPVKVHYNYSDSELVKLMAFDTDEFNRFEAAQLLYKNSIKKWVEDLKEGKELELGADFAEGFRLLLSDENVDEAFLALALSVPTLSELLQDEAKWDFENTNVARNFLVQSLTQSNYELFEKRFKQLANASNGDLSSASMGKRHLRNVCLSFIASVESEGSYELVKDYYYNASNMTAEAWGLKLLIDHFADRAHHAIDAFYKKWKAETLVMQKWLGAQATANDPKVLHNIRELEKCDVYDAKVPNLLRALVGRFAMGNPMQFNSPDGAGYKFVADKIIEIDQYNPQIASRVAKSMNHLKRLDEQRASLLKEQIQRVLTHNLSKDTFEVMSKNLT